MARAVHPQSDRPAPSSQVADPTFDTRVARPAYGADGPRVLFDEAHRNFHTAAGRYKPFVDLISSDGYRVAVNGGPLSDVVLRGVQVLVIANATRAFSEAEVQAVHDWTRTGGALLLITDHPPLAAASEAMARRFEVQTSNATTVDPANQDPGSGSASVIVYTRESGTLLDHPITRGRDARERIERVTTFSGQSLRGPGVGFLQLAPTALDTFPDPQRPPASAAGRCQGLALTAGRGRAVMLGEAAMLSAQLTGPRQRPMGMNRPGNDNRQLALNIMHWLSGPG
jgi:hypothetical protein